MQNQNAIDPRHFRHAMGHFATGITVIATRDRQGQLWGMTANAFSSLSLEPPLVLVCVNLQASSCAAFRASTHFSVNFLSAAQARLSNHFASHDPDKFASVAYRPGLTGAPILADTIGYLECANHEVLPGGDHIILIGRVEHAEVPGGEPLLYFTGRYRQLAPHAE